MAIVIPYLIASTAAGAAAAAAIGVTATTLATLTTVAFAVTGINDKINKAASNVFGEDLVKVANIVGTVYGAYNGGFDISSGGGALADGVSTASDYSASMLARQGGAAAVPTAGLEGAVATSVVPAAASVTSPLPDLGGVDTTQSFSKPGMNLSQMAESGAAPQVAQDPAAVASGAPAAPQLNGSLVSKVTAPGATRGVQEIASVKPSFFDNLKGMATDPKFAGEAIKGIAGGYAQAQAAEQQQAQYERQREDKLRRSRIGNFSLKG